MKEIAAGFLSTASLSLSCLSSPAFSSPSSVGQLYMVPLGET
jgi:hypothetical protein